ncbi:PREDICTED: uncharacterized protein LOC104811405 [Tarenaya hassleriana]|uniref:uncharacterized protein LOC104811405 n=1 Tax=Tarenaya hassleriana TaxID=28532 RepID=UPI00053C83A7|nr:PREDICTED: uncharacterized protein LOC104811405 [Tarenaya hassleriana]
MGKFVISLLVLLVSLDATTSVLGLPLLIRFNIEVANALQSNKGLKVYCRAKDESFPTKVLNVGSWYQMKFRVYLKTLFWCNLWQGPNFQHYAKFDAFVNNKSFVDDVCGGRNPNVCRYEAREDGVYVRDNANGEYRLLIKWDVSP